MGAGDVAQQGFVYVGRLVADDELCLDTALAVLKRGCERQEVFYDAGLIHVEQYCEVFP